MSRLRAHTFSIVARDHRTGELGVAVQSHWFSVGSAVTWSEPGVGAVATQSMALVSHGPNGIALMRSGVPAPAALAALLASDSHHEDRQLALIDAQGRAAAHTGKRCIAEAGHHLGEGYSCQANLMLKNTVPGAMARAFEAATGRMAERMLAALEAAQAEGGDIRGKQSAALQVVSGDPATPPWKKALELRIEDHPEPLGELRRLLAIARGYEMLNSAEEHLVAGRTAEADRLYAQAREAIPGNLEPTFWAAMSRLEHGRREEARAALAELFAKDPIWRETARRTIAAGHSRIPVEELP